MDIRKLIEEINALTEDELIDDFEAQEPLAVEEIDLLPVEHEVDEVSTADSLDAKTKIAKALEEVKESIEYFKQITSEELDLVKDANLNISIEELDNKISEIEAILAGGKIEEPVEVAVEETEVEEPVEEIESDVDFDTEAQLDLFGDEE